MKRFCALLLVSLMCFAPLCGWAETLTLLETKDGLRITLDVEEAVTTTVEPDMPEGTALVSVTSAGHANVMISIAHSELYNDRFLKDMSQDEKDELCRIAGEQYEDPTFVFDTTPSGNEYIHVCSNQADDIDSLFTIYDGYFVELMQSHEDFSPLTEDDEAFCYSLLRRINFVKAE